MPPGFFERLPKYYNKEFSENELRSFKPILDMANILDMPILDCTAFYSNSIFWTYRQSNMQDDLSISERKVQYAIDNNDVYSFSLTIDEQSLVTQGKLERQCH